MSEANASVPVDESSSLTNNSKRLGKNESTSFVNRTKEWWQKTCKQLYPTGFNAELKSLASLACPIFFEGSCFMIFTLTPLYFCGHLESKVELDVAALSISILSATVIAMGFGITNACNTYTSQAFASGAKEKIGLFVQTAFYVTILAILPVIAFHENIGPFLYVLGQDPVISRLVGDYMFIMIPGTISFYFYEVLDKYMIGQSIVLPSMLSNACAAVLNVVLHYILVVRLHMGLLGSSLSLSLSFTFMLVFMFFYIRIRKLHADSWTGFRKESLRYFVPYSKLAYTSMFQVCSEVWIFEIGIFLAGYSSQEELGAQSIVLNLDLFWFQVPIAISIALLTTIGQYISVSNIDGAKTIYRVALTITFLLTSIFCVFIVVWRDALSELFTDKSEVSDEASILLILITIFSLTDALSAVLIGLLLGIGRHLWAFKTTIIGYYVVSLPLGVLLMFATPLRSKGFYIGLAVGSASKFIYLCIVVWGIDWQQEVINTIRRLSGTEIDLDETELANKVLINQSNESPSEHASTTKTPRYEDNIKTSPSCAQQLSKVFIAGDKCSKALQIGLPVTTIAIFIVGIVCTITIQLPGMNYGLFEFTNLSNHHSS